MARVRTPAPTAKPKKRTPATGSGARLLQRRPFAQAKPAGASPIVHDVLHSPGQPLDAAARAFMEPRFGHDFSQVRIHTDGRAAESAQAVNALAYTVGRDVVFGTGQYAPQTSAGRRLLAHELSHVLQQDTASTPGDLKVGETGGALEREAERIAESATGASAGDARTPRELPPTFSPVARVGAPGLLQRDVVDDASGNPISYEFRIGVEVAEPFASLAKKLTKDGSESDDDLRKLRAEAVKRRDTVSDQARMFMAGLLDGANVKLLQAATIGAGKSVTFAFPSITTANMQHVVDLDRIAAPASVTDPIGKSAAALLGADLAEAGKQFSAAETAAAKEIRSLAGASFKSRAEELIKFVNGSGFVFLSPVLQAMLAAASDNTPGDRVLAGVAYAVAIAAANPLASDLLQGKIKVDVLTPANFKKLPGLLGTEKAIYVAAAPLNPKLAGLKGDTIYVQSDLSIANLGDRSAVIHELRHVEDDKAASPTAQPTFPIQRDQEAAAYRAQARYILDQMQGQAAAKRKTSAAQAVTPVNDLVLLGVLIEAKTDLTKYKPLAELLFDAAKPPSHQNAAGVAKLLAVSTAKLEGVLLSEIDKTYKITVSSTSITEGLAGESLIHWIFRL